MSGVASAQESQGAFVTGKYRNVFVEMGYQPAAVEAKLKEVFNDAFRGPNKVYFEVGDTMRPSVALDQEIHAASEWHPRGLLCLELQD